MRFSVQTLSESSFPTNLPEELLKAILAARAQVTRTGQRRLRGWTARPPQARLAALP